jgi:cell division protein FtsB
VAGRERDTTPRKRRKSRASAPRTRKRLRLLWVLGLIVVPVYLYYQPLSSYFDTRADLAGQRAEVEALRSAKTQLERRLAVSTTIDATRREARRIGYLRPGERLFIVKGIPAWREARRNLGGDG